MVTVFFIVLLMPGLIQLENKQINGRYTQCFTPGVLFRRAIDRRRKAAAHALRSGKAMATVFPTDTFGRTCEARDDQQENDPGDFRFHDRCF